MDGLDAEAQILLSESAFCSLFPSSISPFLFTYVMALFSDISPHAVEMATRVTSCQIKNHEISNSSGTCPRGLWLPSLSHC